jgi:hypothetical protein
MNRHRLTLLAFVLFVLVVAGLAIFVYPTTYGVAYLTGRALGSFAIIGLFAAIISKVRKRPVRFDIVFALAIITIVGFSFKDVLAVYDLRRFQSEVRAAGPDKMADAIRSSTTRIGGLYRSVILIGEETSTKVENALSFLDDDPALDSPLAPPKVTDRSALTDARRAAATISSRLPGALPTFDSIIQEEADRIEATADDLTDEMRGVLVSAIKQRRARDREFLERRLDLTSRLMALLTEAVDFLIPKVGTFEIDKDILLFASQQDADSYNALFNRLQSLVQEEEQLGREIQEVENDRVANQWMRVLQ